MTRPTLPPPPDRRTAIKWMLTAAASTTLFRHLGYAAADQAAPITGSGYGTDPDLVKTYQPGELWPLTLTVHQRATAAALCAVIIPADATSKSAAELQVHDFIDEWISAPYPVQARDRPVILEGLKWLDHEAQRRHSRDFVALSDGEQAGICDAICSAPQASPDLLGAVGFFARFRDLTAGGFYTTPEGMRDLGYTGNMPLAAFDGPPPEVLHKLGLT